MKMDRNLNADGRGKYALVLMRKMPTAHPGAIADVKAALAVLEGHGMLDYGEAESPSEFFLIRLKDQCAQAALLAYAAEAATFDTEWAAEVERMAQRSGPASPHCKTPD